MSEALGTRLHLSAVVEAAKRKPPASAREITPELVAGVLLKEHGDDRALVFAREVLGLIEEAIESPPPPPPTESAPVIKRGPLRLVR